MTRPPLSDFLPSIDDVGKAFQSCPDLYRYAQALESYIDSLHPPAAEVEGQEKDVLKHDYYVMKDYDNKFIIWPKNRYIRYIDHAIDVGAGSAYKLVVGFNGDENYLFQKSLPAAASIDGKEGEKELTLEQVVRQNFLVHIKAGVEKRLKQSGIKINSSDKWASFFESLNQMTLESFEESTLNTYPELASRPTPPQGEEEMWEEIRNIVLNDRGVSQLLESTVKKLKQKFIINRKIK